jgi:hypothetical protein
VLALPDWFAQGVAAVADGLGLLGWRSPARSTSLAQLSAGVIGDPARWMAESGIAPKSVDQILAARPASVQDRWFARLYLLKPLAILGLAIAAIVPNAERLAAYLGIGTSSFSGRPMLLGVASSAVALLAGVSLAVRPAARCALLVLLALTLVQLAGFWFRPLISLAGPLDAVAFKLPMVLLILVTLGVLDDR